MKRLILSALILVLFAVPALAETKLQRQGALYKKLAIVEAQLAAMDASRVQRGIQELCTQLGENADVLARLRDSGKSSTAARAVLGNSPAANNVWIKLAHTMSDDTITSVWNNPGWSPDRIQVETELSCIKFLSGIAPLLK